MKFTPLAFCLALCATPVFAQEQAVSFDLTCTYLADLETIDRPISSV